MKQYLLRAPGDLHLIDVPSPKPGPGEIVVRIRAALTCGTDLKTWRRGHPQIPLPAPLGHEFSGVVAAVGAGVKSFSVGDAVMAVHSAPCGSCFYCRAGQENLCETVMESKILGAFADEILLPAHIVARNLHRKPERLDFAEAAFLEPLACVVHGDHIQPMRCGETLLIIGAGPVSLLFLLLARSRGIDNIIVLGRRAARLELARRLGATTVLDVASCDPQTEILQLTAGRGVDQAIECTGMPDVWEGATRLVRKGGRVLLYGGCPSGTTATFDTYRLHYDELTVQGAFHFTPAAVRQAHALLASGAIPVAPLISERLPLSELPAALNRLAAGDGFKYALIP